MENTIILKDMIDHHCHMIQTTIKNDDAMNLLSEAFKQGLYAIIDAGDITKTQQERLALLSQFERAFLVVGMHPLDIENPFNFEEMLAIIDHPKVVGIGEIGLDYSRNDCDVRKQQRLFEAQLTLADQYDLPAMLHVRDAFDDSYQMVKRIGIPRLVVHCFTGDKHEAKRWLDLGAYLSFSGLITFKNAPDIQEALEYTPIDRILCETDSPYLSPAPHRGSVNHPINMIHIYKQAALLKRVPLERLVQDVKDNFINLYRLQSWQMLQTGEDF